MTPRALWACIVAPIWIALALCAHWAPVVRDGWGLEHWHGVHSLASADLWAFVKSNYLHGNPRLGQTVSLLLATPGPWHALVTPVIELAMFTLLAALALGRWPSLRSADDAWLFLFVVALGVATCPVVGPMLLYVPYVGNYVVPVALLALLALPYRFHAEKPRARPAWFAAALFVLGIAVGLCNEHTGIAVLAGLACAVVAFVRRGERLAPWMIAGVLGVALGYAALLFAPGQAMRYDGLAAQDGPLDFATARGVLGGARIVGSLALHLAACVPWVVAALIARRGARADSPATRASRWILGGAALVATLALCASPIVGDRLYAASTLLAAAPLAGWIHARTTGSGARHACRALAIAVLAVVGWQCLAAYRVLGPAGDARLAQVQAARPGDAVVVAPFPIAASHWSVGEDLDEPVHRARVAADYGLSSMALVLAGE